MRSLLFFNESLGYGGAESVLTNIIEYIDKNRFDLSVLCETDGELHTDAVRANAHFKSIAKKSRAASFFGRAVNSGRMRLLKNASPGFAHRLFIHGRYDVEIAFCEGFSAKFISGSPDKRTKKVAWIHTDVVNYPWSESVHGGAENEKRCYEKFDAVVCVSQTMKDSFVKKYGMEQKVHVLYNPIDFDAVKQKSLEPVETDNDGRFGFVMVGSLKPVKGYDRMMSVCSRLKKEGYDFKVRIMGSGSEYSNISDSLSRLGLSNTVTLMEYQENPFKYVRNSDVFVCSSYAEGYSTAVCEAVVLGVPVITTECSGMREIFGGRECGIICENSDDGLYYSMKKVLDDPSVLRHYKAEEQIRSADFDIKERIKKIEEFLDNI